MTALLWLVYTIIAIAARVTWQDVVGAAFVLVVIGVLVGMMRPRQGGY